MTTRQVRTPLGSSPKTPDERPSFPQRVRLTDGCVNGPADDWQPIGRSNDNPGATDAIRPVGASRR